MQLGIAMTRMHQWDHLLHCCRHRKSLCHSLSCWQTDHFVALRKGWLARLVLDRAAQNTKLKGALSFSSETSQANFQTLLLSLTVQEVNGERE